MLSVKEWLAKINAAIQDLLSRKYVVYDGAYGLKMKMVTRTVTSNSSGLINITDLGASSSNCSGLQVMCTTSNYRVSNPILWNNFNYYVALYAWNSAAVQANKTVSLIATWFEA